MLAVNLYTVGRVVRHGCVRCRFTTQPPPAPSTVGTYGVPSSEDAGLHFRKRGSCVNCEFVIGQEIVDLPPEEFRDGDVSIRRQLPQLATCLRVDVRPDRDCGIASHVPVFSPQGYKV